MGTKSVEVRGCAGARMRPRAEQSPGVQRCFASRSLGARLLEPLYFVRASSVDDVWDAVHLLRTGGQMAGTAAVRSAPMRMRSPPHLLRRRTC